MSMDEQERQRRIAIVMAARHFYREPRAALPDESAPLPEMYPHHWEEMIGIEPIPYEPGDRWYAKLN